MEAKGERAMQASEIVWHNEESIRFMQALGTLTDEEWRRPLGPGKWTVAEVAGHFAPWDRFVLEQRLPYFFAEGPLPKGPDAVRGMAAPRGKAAVAAVMRRLRNSSRCAGS